MIRAIPASRTSTGLGINPADDSLVVATHYASFRISTSGDDAERIGDSFQDTMGFTVAGPDRFLGSGHLVEFSSSPEGGFTTDLSLIHRLMSAARG